MTSLPENKICLIRQSCGIGDIFFCQKIGYHYHNKGYRVIWPVIKEFSYIRDYISNFEYPCVDNDFPFKDIYLSNINSISESDNLLFIPLHGHQLRCSSVMHSKYNLAGLLYHDWNKYFNFIRNQKNENRLFYDILNLKDKEEYIFLNRTFASPPTSLTKNINLNTTKRIIELSMVDDITIFDWCKVLENAAEIHTVETSLNYLIEKLDNTTNLQMYSKWDPPNYSAIKGIFKKKWIYND